MIGIVINDVADLGVLECAVDAKCLQGAGETLRIFFTSSLFNHFFCSGLLKSALISVNNSSLNFCRS